MQFNIIEQNVNYESFFIVIILFNSTLPLNNRRLRNSKQGKNHPQNSYTHTHMVRGNFSS